MSRRKQNREKRNSNKEKKRNTAVSEDYGYNPKPLRALNDKQRKYINAINNHSITVGTGYPGTGKSYIPAVMAANALKDPNSPIKKIVICRPNEGVGKTIGLLPGDINDKMKAWCAPIVDVLYDVLGKSYVDYLIEGGIIELLPLEYARGKSYPNSFIILDEAQNVDKESLKCLMTRIGMDTKLVIDGDVGQCDIGRTSGLGQLLDLMDKYYTPMAHVDFGIEDIVRSDICRTLIELFVEAKF
jgi:phosphate starvation-inducible PhoH-like protein